MTEYAVGWSIDVDADSPQDAARRALAIQRDPSSTATVFDVAEHGTDGRRSVRVDLGTVDGAGEPVDDSEHAWITTDRHGRHLFIAPGPCEKYQRDRDLDGPDGERYCWCGWDRWAHRHRDELVDELAP